MACLRSNRIDITIIGQRARQWLTGICLSLILVGSAIAPVLAQGQASDPATDEDARRRLFESVFGDRQQVVQRPLELSLVVDDQNRGTVSVRILEDGNISLRADDVLAALRTLIISAAMRDLASAAGRDAYLNFAELAEMGLAAEYQQRSLAVFIYPAPEIKTRRTIALRATGIAGSDDRKITVNNAPFSAFANIRAGGSYLHDRDGNSADRLPLSLTLETAANMGRWTLETDFAYADGAPGGLRRAASRLIRDFPDKAIRTQIGDLIYPVTGFAGFKALGGFAVAKNFSLEPYRIVQPLGSQEFQLNSTSRVQIRQNGVLTNEYMLRSGTYDITNFATAAGLNELEIQITDATGDVITITDQVYFDDRLLARGLQEFSYAAGFPMQVRNGKNRYDNEDFTATFFHRIGVTDNLTLGASGFADGDEALLGVEASAGGSYGFLSSSAASSFNHGGKTGFAARLAYRLIGGRDSFAKGQSLAASVLYRSAFFRRDGDSTANNLAVDLSLRYGQGITERFGFSADTRYGIRRSGLPNTWSAGGSIYYQLTDRLRAQANFRHAEDPSLAGENRLLISLVHRFENPAHNLRASLDTATDTRQLEYTYQPDGFINRPSFNAVLSNRPDVTSFSAEADMSSYFFAGRLSHSALKFEGDDGLRQTTSFSIGTAIAFADGQFAVGRPITTGFAIFTAHDSISELDVDLTYSGRERIGGLNRLRTALVPELTAYQNSAVSVSIAKLPAGYDAGPGLYRINPNFKGGAVVTVGTAATVMLDGVLLDSQGAALALQAGEMAATDEADPPLQFFTNRSGRFRIFGLRPVTYVMTLYSQSGIEVAIVIPEDASGIVRFGDVTFE